MDARLAKAARLGNRRIAIGVRGRSDLCYMQPPMANREAHMRRALAEAGKGRQGASPNPMVGCVIARGDQVVATGFHRRAGTPHAEVVALKKAGDAARGADLYVNLEPCNHVGRTGPCSEAIIAAGIRRVFVGMRDPNPLVNGRGLRRLRKAGIAVEVGLLAGEAKQLNEAFVHVMAEGRPFVIAKIAQSLDGRIATHTGQSQWITGKEARAEGHRLRGEVDGIVVGVGTVLADDPRLTCRAARGRDPVRIILDTRARTPAKAQVIRVAKGSNAPTWIVVGSEAPKAKLRALEKAGARLLVAKTKRGRIDPKRLMTQLAEQQLLSLLVEGGPTLLGSLFDAGLVDKVHAFVAPALIGGVAAPGSVGGKGVAKLDERLRLSRLSVSQLGEDLHLVGYPTGRK